MGCEQLVTHCLMVTQTCCYPGARAMYMSLRGSKHASSTLDWTKPTISATYLVLDIFTYHFNKSALGLKIMTDVQ